MSLLDQYQQNNIQNERLYEALMSYASTLKFTESNKDIQSLELQVRTLQSENQILADELNEQKWRAVFYKDKYEYLYNSTKEELPVSSLPDFDTSFLEPPADFRPDPEFMSLFEDGTLEDPKQ